MPDQPCRSCGAPLLWTITVKGKRHPVDRDPHPEGTIKVVAGVSGAAPKSYVMAGLDLATMRADGVALHRSHFATCPQAAQHRRPRGRREPTTEDTP